MPETNHILDELIDKEVDTLIEKDAFYQLLSTPIKPASVIKQQHRRQLVEFFKLTDLHTQLDAAQSIILNGLPNLISSQDFSKVKDEIDKSPDHFFSFVEMQEEEDEKPENPVLLQQMFGLSNETLLHVYDFGANLLENGNIQDACALFTFLTTLAPHVSSYWIALGVCFQELNKKEDAIISFGAANFLEPMDPAPLFYILECYLALKETDKAKLEVDELKKILPSLEKDERAIWVQKINNLLSSQ